MAYDPGATVPLTAGSLRIALLMQGIAQQICCIRDDSKLLKEPEGFHQHLVFDDLALHNVAHREHPDLPLLATWGNSEPRTFMRTFHQELAGDAMPSLNICSILKE